LRSSFPGQFVKSIFCNNICLFASYVLKKIAGLLKINKIKKWRFYICGKFGQM
jgi:hypothetical protein